LRLSLLDFAATIFRTRRCTRLPSWADKTAVEWHCIAPGKPMQNAFIESFNGRLRDEFLERDLVLHPGAGPDRSVRLEGGLQWITSPLETRLADARRL
jgi:transposase InsO family protein